MRLYDKNMIEMRDGRKPVISPQLKSVSNYIDVSLDDIREACEAAFKNHSKKNIVNYEIRSNNKNEPNWIKCLIGIPETNKEGIPTGRKLAREFHGNYQGIVNFISKCELTYGKDAILPITDVEIENRCGYVFKGSTNRLEYID